MADAKRDEVERILGRSLITAETFAAELRERLTDELGDLGGFSQQLVIDFAREILDEFEPIMAQALTDAEVAAWVSGTDSVVRILPPASRSALAGGAPGSVSGVFSKNEPVVRFPAIERAAESLIERNIVTRPEFDRMSREAAAKAFTVARQDSLEVIGRIRETLTETITEGASLEEFRDRLGEELEASFIGPAHLENVYRTNIQAAFHQAHEEMADHPIVRDIFPYQEYLPIDDGRVREEHLALGTLGLSGTGVYRRDDPMWDFFTPPWDYQCRCGTNLLTVERAAAKGVEEARRWLRTGEPPVDPEWKIDAIPFRPAPDWVRAA